MPGRLGQVVTNLINFVFSKNGEILSLKSQNLLSSFFSRFSEFFFYI